MLYIKKSPGEKLFDIFNVTALILLAATLVALLSGAASADTVHLENGSVVEGRARRVGDHVVVVTPAGEVKLPAAEVTSDPSGVSPVPISVIWPFSNRTSAPLSAGPSMVTTVSAALSKYDVMLRGA